MTPKFDDKTQEILNRLAAIDLANPKIDRPKVEECFRQHMEALELPMLPVRWFSDSASAYKYVTDAARSAAWSAALSAAESAAWSAARSAAWNAAESAAWSAARSAALNAALSAAWSAAWSAARSAARSAAWNAAESAAWSAARSAAESAALSAAWSAAWSAAGNAAVDMACKIWLPFVEAKEAGLYLFWVTEKEIIAVEAPSLKIDNDVLHCSIGPAVSWPTGEAYYFWRGVQVPKKWILDPKGIHPETALTWKNIEQRRCAAEIIGWEKVLSILSAKELDRDKDPMIGKLLQVDLPDSPEQKFLRVKCGTGRDFCIPVPSEMETALQAQAWMWELDAKQILNYEVRT
jgi:hypothetical protein